MVILNYELTRFLSSVSNLFELPVDNNTAIEVAVIGYSNVGKSSMLNVLINKKNLVKIGKRPGSTKNINVFQVIPEKRLIDFPGYGYALVSKKKIRINLYNILNYLEKRVVLKGIICLMDVRYPLKEFDRKILTLVYERKISSLIFLTKVDKLSINQRYLQLNSVREELLKMMLNIEVELFSSVKKIGIKKLQNTLNLWFKQ